jgi:hypothetical protein
MDFSTPNIIMAIRLSTPVFTKAVANIRLPMINQVASDQYNEATLLRSTIPGHQSNDTDAKATMGKGMASVIKQNTTKSTIPTAA